MVVPQNAGFCIINETMYITAATDLSNRKAFVNPQPTTAAAAPAAAPELDQVAKEKMALAFSEKSGMNLKFSAICLEENNWNFDKAATVFSEAQGRGAVPPEAFTK